MNRTASLILAGLLAAAGASAGPLLTGELTVAAGETNAVGEITLNPSGALEAPAIDRVFVLNASGAGTGTVAFAALAAGVAVPIAATNAVLPGADAALWPRRAAAAGAATNVEAYTAHKLRASVTQAAVASDTVYTFGAIVR